MRIFVLPVPGVLQPQKQTFNYPTHNRDYGIEQDFYIWLKRQPGLITNDPFTADWHYLPIYWTRWHINHNFAVDSEGIEQLQQLISNIIIDDSKTFTITQFDGGTLVNCGKTVVFTAGRTINAGIDIPILCSPHRKPPLPVTKKYIASFNGSFGTHPIRVEMQKKLADNEQVIIGDCLPTRFYKRWFWAKNYNLNTMASYIALCPRGTNATSFRFFEAMQLGTAPCLIGDIDVRPFKKFIPWDEISYYAASIDELEYLLKTLDKKKALKKGKAAYQYWKNELYYQKWCKYIPQELESIR